MTWTRFMDMHSGGGTKEPPYEFIYIEAPEDEAKVIFYNRFDHNPERVTCTCCGDDYSIGDSETLAEASAYDRGCKYDNEAKRWIEEPDDSHLKWGGSVKTLMTVEEYIAQPNVLVIQADEIKDSERIGDVPEQGYVWAG